MYRIRVECMTTPRQELRFPSAALPLFAILLFLAAGCAASFSPKLLREGTPSSAGMDLERLQQVDMVIEEAIADRIIPGAVLIVGRQGKIVWNRAYGQRAWVPVEEPMTLDTIFDMASMTKPIATAASVMRLVERGKMRLQDRVSVYLPEFASAGKAGIRVAQLLTHTSGLAPGVPWTTLTRDYGAYCPEAVWWWVVENPPRIEPDTDFLYSDLNYLTLRMIVERVTGESMAEFAWREIYSPLGMTDTGFYPSPEHLSRVAPTEQLENELLRGIVHDPMSRLLGGIGGSAGLFSTARDISIFSQMILNGGVYGGKRIYGPLTLQAMSHDQDRGRG
ncbi:serine hydrolase domain-containing protein, partial [Gemmatimonadota bacterium]